MFGVHPHISADEEAAFLRAADRWFVLTGGKIVITTDRSTYGAGPTLYKIVPELEADFDAKTRTACEEHNACPLYAAEAEMNVWFVPSRLRADQLEVVFTHELGHVLGLPDIDEEGALMHQNPRKWDGTLHDEDRQLLRVCFTSKT